MYILRITLKSYKKINFLKNLLFKLKKINISIIKPFTIKKKQQIFTVLKSPHVNKKSREHFIYRNYVQKIDIKFKNIYTLINYLIIIKKILNDNFIIKTKIIKK